jgi:hypothetical protein
MNNKNTTFTTVADLLAACEKDPEARRFLELAKAFLEEGWDIHDFRGDRFDATQPVGEDGVESYGVFVDVDPDEDYVGWTATRYLEDDQYEFYDSSATGRDILKVIEDETGFPYEDAPLFRYTLYVED